MEIDYGNRNCYNCGDFGHIVKYCRNWEIGNKIGKGRKLEYGENRNNEQQRIVEKGNSNNLNGDRDLIVLN